MLFYALPMSIHVNIGDNGIFVDYFKIAYSNSIVVLSIIMIGLYIITNAIDTD